MNMTNGNLERKICTTTAFVLLGLLVAPDRLWAQGCALCARNAAATGPEGGQALNFGILLLLVPALLIFVGILWVAFLNRNAEAFPDDSEDRGHGLREPAAPLQTSYVGEIPSKRLGRPFASG
ncbi:MAG: hypothetical protein O7F56_08015 [Acidobacteria bacterium]|nr:hypothetical protein [Acidobacteriota bacterium]